MKMKTCLFAALLAPAVWNVAGQGTINFANGSAGVNAPVPPINGQRLEGPDWSAELLLISADGSSTSVGEPAAFEYGELAGYFFGGSVTVPGVAPGTTAVFQVRVYDAQQTLERFSSPVAVTLGGGKMPPPNLVGLENWTAKELTMLPQLTISLVQQNLSLSWSKDLPNAIVEFTENLTNPNWTAATETAQTVGEKLTLTIKIASSERYYRLRLR